MLTVAATCRIGFHSNRMGSSIYQSLSKVIKKTLNFYIPVQVFSPEDGWVSIPILRQSV